MSIVAIEASRLFPSLNDEFIDEAQFQSLKPDRHFIGQDRAKAALAFGLSTERPDYNIFVMGNCGTGKHALATHYVSKAAKLKVTPSDWVYVRNFDDRNRPWSIQLPSGIGKSFISDCQALFARLAVIVISAFENPGYQKLKSLIESSLHGKIESVVENLELLAADMNIAIYQEDSVFSFSPVVNGQVIDDLAFSQLDKKERDELNHNIDILEKKLADDLVELPQWQRETFESIESLNFSTIEKAISNELEQFEHKYIGVAGVDLYFELIKKNLPQLLLDNLEIVEIDSDKGIDKFRQLLSLNLTPNLFISHEKSIGAPVIYETQPTYSNIFGRIEHSNESGILHTDHHHIRPGSIHNAAGGYLILEVGKIIENPSVWKMLKQVIQTQEITFEQTTNQQGLLQPIELKPHGISAQVRLILIGLREHYYLLREQDPEFGELFRVLVDSDDVIEKDRKTVPQLAQVIKALSFEQKLADMNFGAFEEVVRYSSRLCEQQDKLSAQIGEVFALVCEADMVRVQLGESLISRRHVKEAMQLRERRHSRILTNMISEVKDGRISINTHSPVIGSINGLTVWTIGTTEFGLPVKITATTSPGTRGIIDIERESELGLALHTKGVMILSGLLASRYAKCFPLTLTANVVMEQSYGLIDGDSASLAEFCALISSIIERPASRALALTGSINQLGQVQAVGGVNEKIEGYYAICKTKGLTGKQGVIIPRANLNQLILDDDIVAAVEKKMFNIYAIETIDEAFKLLFLSKDEPFEVVEQLISTKLKSLYEFTKPLHPTAEN